MRFIITFLSFAFFLCACSDSDEKEAGKILETWNLSATMTATLTDKGILTIKTTKDAEDMPHYVNPLQPYGGYGVEAPWYNLRHNIFTVVIGEGVSSIGYWAFVMSNVSSVTMPNSLITIGAYAFDECTSLTSVAIPNSVTTIGYQSFKSCISLTSVTIPNSVTTIGGGAFSYCSSLASVTIGNSVTTIGRNAFSSCISLTSITMPNSVTTIEWDAFNSCSSLTSITIPNSVTTIEWGAFSLCEKLKDVTVSWNIPLNLDNAIFTNFTDFDITLHVPAGTEYLYRAARFWNDCIITSS